MLEVTGRPLNLAEDLASTTTTAFAGAAGASGATISSSAIRAAMEVADEDFPATMSPFTTLHRPSSRPKGIRGCYGRGRLRT
ncbi:MAG: hypothetical protein SFU84_15150 [Gemmatimonadales bacterium]|nr:hypothetical protein [Gemmatimonadales bacterium]